MFALLDFASTGEPSYLELLTTIDEWLLDQLAPEIFDDGDARNVLTQARHRFGKLCAALTEQGFPSPQELTLFDFNQAVDYLIEKHKQD